MDLFEKDCRGLLEPFDNRRSFTSVDNLTFVISKILSTEIESGIYNMADDEALSTNELIEVMCSAMMQNAHVLKINTSFIKFCSRIGDVLHLPLNSFGSTNLRRTMSSRTVR